MSEEMIIKQCSPTLAGMKTGSIFNCTFLNKKILWNEIRHLNTLLSKKGLRIIPLAVESRKALIFIYRPDRLEKDIIREESVSILKECGYCRISTQDCIAHLKKGLVKAMASLMRSDFFWGILLKMSGALYKIRLWGIRFPVTGRFTATRKKH